MSEQGSPEWVAERLGEVTASCFVRCMTNGRGSGTMGQTAYSYMRDVIAERLTGRPQDQVDTYAIRWGNENEPQARAMYCLRNDTRVQQVGFVKHPSFPGVGGSPDGLVEGDPDGPGGLELKCPLNSRIHLEYIENGGVPKDYEWQVYGLMWITGRQWWDFCSFDPRMPEHLQLFQYRCRWDDEKIEDLSERIARFMEQLNIKQKKIEEAMK